MLPATKRGRPSAAYSSAIAPGEPCRGDVEVDGHVALTPLLETRSRRLEGAGLDDVASRVKETAVHALDDLRRMDGKAVHPSLERGTPEVVDARVLGLQAGPHGAVENEHALAQRVKERRSISCRHRDRRYQGTAP